MLSQKWKYKTVILTTITITVVGAISLPTLKITKTLAQTPSVQSQCTDVEIKKRIQQLDKVKTADFNALVGCKSKAVAALIKVLNETKDENVRMITIAALGEIGASAAPAVSVLNKLLNDKSQEIRTISVYALRKIGKDPVPPFINSLQDKDSNVRSKAAYTLGQLGTEAKDAIPALTIALKDKDSNVRSQAAYAIEKIKLEKKDVMFINQTNSGTDYGTVSGTIAITQATGVHLRNKPPVMCNIRVIKAVLRWKCP